jgi:DTW domain-containing protein
LCAEVPVVATRTRIVIVRHYGEVTRSSNSGRLAAMALPNSELIDHGAPGTAATHVDAEGACLLFPGGEPLSAERAPARLIVLDATWSQVRRMRRKVGGLESIRTVSLPELSTAAPRMRASPGQGKVSTIEAIAYALGVLEGPAAQAPLLALFAAAVARSRASGRRGAALGVGALGAFAADRSDGDDADAADDEAPEPGAE